MSMCQHCHRMSEDVACLKAEIDALRASLADAEDKNATLMRDLELACRDLAAVKLSRDAAEAKLADAERQARILVDIQDRREGPLVAFIRNGVSCICHPPTGYTCDRCETLRAYDALDAKPEPTLLEAAKAHLGAWAGVINAPTYEALKAAVEREERRWGGQAMSEETKVVLGIAGAFLLGLLFVSAASVGKERAHYDYERGYAAAVDSVRAVEGYGWTTRTLDALGVPYTITIGDSTATRSVIHVGGHK